MSMPDVRRLVGKPPNVDTFINITYTEVTWNYYPTLAFSALGPEIEFRNGFVTDISSGSGCPTQDSNIASVDETSIFPDIDNSQEVPACAIASDRILQYVEIGMSKSTIRRLVGKPRTVNEATSFHDWSYSDKSTLAFSQPTLEFRFDAVISYDAGDEDDCLPLPEEYDPDGFLMQPLPDPTAIPANSRATTGQSVITLEQGSFYDFRDIHGDIVSADSMPVDSYFTSKPAWTCSYYVANEEGFQIAERYRGSSFEFLEGGLLRFNGIDTTWNLNNTEISMGNMFF